MSRKGITPKTAQRIRNEKGIEDTKLQKQRLKKGFSQNDLAVVSGITKRSIQQYEQSPESISKVGLEKICSLCIALDCRIEDIIEDKTLIDKYRLVK